MENIEKWPLIETAPRDGRKLLLWNADWSDSDMGTYYQDVWVDSNLGVFHSQPTHWMYAPIPNREHVNDVVGKSFVSTLSTIPSIPSTYEIEQTVEIIQKKIDSGKLSDQVEKGYQEALDILVYRKDSYKHISPTLMGVQARAIAGMAIDYLAGEVSQNVLVGVERQPEDDY